MPGVGETEVGACAQARLPGKLAVVGAVALVHLVEPLGERHRAGSAFVMRLCTSGSCLRDLLVTRGCAKTQGFGGDARGCVMVGGEDDDASTVCKVAQSV